MSDCEKNSDQNPVDDVNGEYKWLYRWYCVNDCTRNEQRTRESNSLIDVIEILYRIWICRELVRFVC